MELKEKMKVIESISDGGSTFEVLEFENLDGASVSYYGYGALLCKTGWA